MPDQFADDEAAGIHSLLGLPKTLSVLLSKSAELKENGRPSGMTPLKRVATIDLRGRFRFNTTSFC